MNFHLLDTGQTIALLESRRSGLTGTEVKERHLRYGANEITERKRKPAWKIFLGQFADFMIFILMAAAVVSGVIGDIEDTYVILIIIVLNAVIGFVQEYRAEEAMAALRKMAASTAKVYRDDNVSLVPSSELVPGDIIVIEAGNIVPADIRLLEAVQLTVDEASLTGESHSVLKHSDRLSGDNLALGDRNNMGFKGTLISSGRGTGVVVATGMETEIGKIAGMLQTEGAKTPLQRRLNVFGRKLAIGVVLICLVIFVVGIIRGEAPLMMLLTSISLAVAAIPEALPAVITISLAFGAKRMVRVKALIRNLPAVETLGSVTYICTDKTGTLTHNKMEVIETGDGVNRHLTESPDFKSGHANAERLLLAMALNNDVEVSGTGELAGDPTEVALYILAGRCGMVRSEMEKSYPRVNELPFDAERKYMTTIHRSGDKFLIVTKGASDVLVAKSKMPADANEAWIRQGEAMAASGLRVLAFSVMETDRLPEEINHENIEQGLQLVGIAGLADPPREEARNAVQACKEAGIHTVMITGDHALTARAIAKYLGIIDSEGDLIMTGAELGVMSDQELRKKIGRIRVYARVSPEQKFRIVNLLQEAGEYVAMTGDGVNDAPSLKKADIGVAMGITGTDVAKDASDMVLLDDNFATIVAAVKEGRRIFDNIRKFIRYTMTSNAGEIWCIFLAPFFGLPIPLLPIHILWINLVTDGLPGLALASEKAERNIMSRPPRDPKENFFAGGLGTHILWVGLLMGVISILTEAVSLKLELVHWQTMVLTVLCFSQMGHVFAIRSERLFLFSQGILSNKNLVFAVLVTFVLQLSIIYIPVFNELFKTTPLTLTELFTCIGVSLIVFHAVELEKLIMNRKRRKKSVSFDKMQNC